MMSSPFAECCKIKYKTNALYIHAKWKLIRSNILQSIILKTLLLFLYVISSAFKRFTEPFFLVSSVCLYYSKLPIFLIWQNFSSFFFLFPDLKQCVFEKFLHINEA